MNFRDLRDRVTLATVSNESHEYLAVTPVIKTPATLPYRIVLIHDLDSDKLVVYTEYFQNYQWALSGSIIVSHPSFSGGHYFNPDQLHLAIKKFGERVADHGENFLESVYREDNKKAA